MGMPIVGSGGRREPPEIKEDEGWAHQGAGVRSARRWSDLARSFRTNQSNYTLKAMLRWRIAGGRSSPCRSGDNARGQHRCGELELRRAARGRSPAIAGRAWPVQHESDWPKSRSDGCARSLWARRGGRSGVRTPWPGGSSGGFDDRERNPSSERRRAHHQKTRVDGWRWPRGGCNAPDSGAPAGVHRRPAWHRRPNPADGGGAAVGGTAFRRPARRRVRRNVIACGGKGV